MLKKEFNVHFPTMCILDFPLKAFFIAWEHEGKRNELVNEHNRILVAAHNSNRNATDSERIVEILRGTELNETNDPFEYLRKRIEISEQFLASREEKEREPDSE